MARPYRRALITGASRGIGEAIARDLAGRGVDLVLVARTADDLATVAGELERTHHVTVEVLVADLLDADDLERVARRVTESPAVDLVVNNAGFGTVGSFDRLDLDGELGQVGLNVAALVRLTHAAAATFRLLGHGGILNVSSIAGFSPAPNTATYAASKAFVTSFTQAVHEELRGSGVHVTTLCPGFTRTAFHDAGNMTTRRIPSVAWSTSAEVARAGVDGVLANRAVVVPGAANRALTGLTRMLPGAVTRRTAGLIAARLEA